ncbi:hypothetical protein BDN70DRAFT_876067 [Pholiota conissans]|uniref:Uncharacterized protein n=1 Tax=Pholiota conissans TaxID=109636 RepID=A0A9P6D2M9_9AGAR|nr:hypothetical protein BDN70DRAFT_876067 [Pholiota conissans]
MEDLRGQRYASAPRADRHRKALRAPCVSTLHSRRSSRKMNHALILNMAYLRNFWEVKSSVVRNVAQKK